MHYSLHQHFLIFLTIGAKNNWESLYFSNKVSKTDFTGLKVTTILITFSVDIVSTKLCQDRKSLPSITA